ncbi:MAG: methyltransferase domain-containing protein [Neisseriaceae bacterium]|nr:MAG: methyltransferase domain-containing protein [Neisseriaceae bacterium]
MQNLARYQHLQTIAQQVLYFENTTEWLLTKYFRKHQNLGKQDRHFISDSIYTLLRNRETIQGYLVKTQKLSLVNQINIAVGLAFYEHKDLYYIDLLEDFLDYQQNSVAVNEQAELPMWIVQLLSEKLNNQDIIELGQSLKNTAPVDIRTNTIKIKRDELIQKLKENNILSTKTPYSPWGIRLQGNHPRLTQYPFYKEGLFEIQDEGSQLIAYLSQPKKNQNIIDFCAGTGGKTLAIGAMLNNRGSIYAFDVEANRLNQLKLRLKKSKLNNIYPILIQNEKDEKLRKFQQKYDIILIDAPCSGLGTIRRQPDLKYRNSPSTIQKMTEKQLSILNEAEKLCHSSGKLVYATCSILPQENEYIIQKFLRSHTNYQLIDCQKYLSGITMNKNDMGIYLNPLLTQTDGFYIAIMKKN